MTEVIIKHRLFTWFKEVDSPMQPGTTVLQEQIAHMGEEVDITNPAYVTRGQELGAFYTDEEAEKIRNGTYNGPDRMILANMRAGIKPVALIQPVDGEGAVDLDALSVDELADHIRNNSLTPQQVIDLAGDDEESIEKVLDAETMATDNEPRDDVVEALEAKLTAAAAASGSGGPQVDATDAAVKLAEEHSLDLRKIKGTGANGRITQDDVKAVVEKQS
jgi:pyruvate/2-oxoglutarate dehydrogenase complex dihydrolipoamide acyltransferase (E2) component